MRFLDSFFLLKLFSDMCYLLFPRYHPHFFPNYRGAWRDQFKSWEFWHFFSVHFLNSFFLLLKLFPGMCCLFFLTHHPHFCQTTGEQGRTNWRVESFDTFLVSFVDSFFLLNLFSCMRYLLLLAYYPQFSLISDYLSLTTFYLPLTKYFFNFSLFSSFFLFSFLLTS